MTRQEAKKAAKRVNNGIQSLGNYHDGIPVAKLDDLLTRNGFDATEAAIYCGREGRANHAVGGGMYLNMSWYKMDVTGRYEIVAYVA